MAARAEELEHEVEVADLKQQLSASRAAEAQCAVMRCCLERVKSLAEESRRFIASYPWPHSHEIEVMKHITSDVFQTGINAALSSTAGASLLARLASAERVVEAARAIRAQFPAYALWDAVAHTLDAALAEHDKSNPNRSTP